MLGMHFDGDVNVITVPVHYSKRIENPRDWWWYRWETAVGHDDLGSAASTTRR